MTANCSRRMLCTAALALLAGCAGTQPAERPQGLALHEAFDAALEVARKARTAAAHGEAGQLFADLGKQAPDSFALAFNEAVEWSRAGAHGRAVEAYRRALRLKPDSVPALTNLFTEALNWNHPDTALRSISMLLKMNRKDPTLHLALAEALRRKGQHRQALKVLAGILVQDPRHAEALTLQAATLADTGRNGEALLVARRALAARPGDAAASEVMGLVLASNKQYGAALASLTEAAESRPSARRNLALLYLEVGDFEQAYAEARRAADAEPTDGRAALAAAAALVGLGRFKDAAREYEVLAASPWAPPASLYNLGLLHDRHLRQPERALEHYRRFLETEPRPPGNHPARERVRTLEKTKEER